MIASTRSSSVRFATRYGADERHQASAPPPGSYRPTSALSARPGSLGCPPQRPSLVFGQPPATAPAPPSRCGCTALNLKESGERTSLGTSARAISRKQLQGKARGAECRYASHDLRVVLLAAAVIVLLAVWGVVGLLVEATLGQMSSKASELVDRSPSKLNCALQAVTAAGWAERVKGGPMHPFRPSRRREDHYLDFKFRWS